MTVEELLERCDLVRASEKKLDECKQFSCGEEDLDEFFAKDCLVNQQIIADERLEAKYMGIGVGRLPLNTRLMYFDLLKLNINED